LLWDNRDAAAQRVEIQGASWKTIIKNFAASRNKAKQPRSGCISGGTKSNKEKCANDCVKELFPEPVRPTFKYVSHGLFLTVCLLTYADLLS
jgi:hypothetical protein